VKIVPYQNTYGNVLLPGQTPEDILLEELGDAYRDYRKRWHEASNFKYRPPFPIHLDIETIYACNLKCVMCPWGQPDYKHPSDTGNKLDKEVLKDVIKKGVKKGLSSLRFSGLNEPLLDKDLPEIISFGKDNGIQDVFITTNGVLLTEDVSRALIKAGTTHLMVSLDAATPETYAKIRIGSNYEKVVNNINTFLKTRASLKSRLPLLRLSFTKMQPNVHEAEEFAEMWAKKADYIAITGYLNNITDPNKNSQLTLDKGGRLTVGSFKCSQPWTRCIIFTNGDVFPCCMNYGRYAPMGNIYKDDLADIWHSERVRKLQDIAKSGEYFKHEICKNCIPNRDVFELNNI
jgi:radical SAM protein with 4Fe4S-binding SPASM domain